MNEPNLHQIMAGRGGSPYIPLKLDTQTPKFEVIAAWHSRSNHSQLHMWMVEQLMKLFK